MYQQHQLSAAFPAMDAEDFQALKDSIENIGVQNPIALLDGMVIDGWHRYTAATELGMDCPVVELGDVDPVDFVRAQNKARRHLPLSAWALIEVSLRQWKPSHRPDKGELSSPLLASNQEMADAVGVTKRTIQQAKTVHSSAAPEVVEAVKRGEIGLTKAAKIAQLPKEDQAAAIAKPIPKKETQKASGPHDERDDMMQMIAQENDVLRDRLAAEAMDASEEEKTLAHQTITELRERVRVLEIEMQAIKDMRDAYQRENAEMKRQISSMQRKMGGV